MKWTSTRDRERYGVAIYNFCSENEWCLKLNVGDTVHILEELEGWYFGYALHNKALRGVFPKSYIKVRDCIVDKTSAVETVTARLPPIVQEVTAVLREWGLLLRELYLERSPHFQLVKDMMVELIAWRKKILSGQLPGDELKQLKQRITKKIDLGNSLLGLDLVVRDEHGNILNPDITSTISLYRHHHDAAQVIKKIQAEGTPTTYTTVKRKTKLSWTAIVNIVNVVIKVPEQSEISLGLYVWDGRESRERPLTEPLIFTWTPDGYNEQLGLLNDLRCIFNDLNTMSLEKESHSIYLIGYVVREGSMVTKEVDPRRTSMLNKKPLSNDALRRPYGVLVLEITQLVRGQMASDLTLGSIDQEDRDTFAPLFLCGEKDTPDSLVRKMMVNRNDVVRENKMGMQGIHFSFTLLNGDIKQLREENPHYVSLHEVPVASRLGLSEVIMPGDVRNDLYITLVSGEFSRGPKTSDRNVEVTVRVYTDKGQLIPGVISQGVGKECLNEYRSVTYHHEAKPKWMETFKVALPIEEFKRAHIKFTMKHRSTNDSKTKHEKPFAMAYMQLMQSNGTTLQNTDHDLIVYKIDSKKWSEDDFGYLKLRWRAVPGEELDKTAQHGLSPSSKDSFTINTVFCSTKLTQNAELQGLLEWGWSGSTDTEALHIKLEGLRGVSSKELVIFLQDTLDVLLEILMNNSTDDESDNKVFEALVYVISVVTDMSKHEAFQPVLDSYIQQNFHATLAYNKLIHVLRFYVEQGNVPERQSTLKKAMKCLQYIFKFIIRSRQLFVELYERGQEEFEKILKQLLESMAQMMLDTSDSTLTVQAQCLRYITTTIPDVITTFDPVTLSEILIKMLNNLPKHRIAKQKLMTVGEIIHSQLFKIPECRELLLPAFIDHLRKLLVSSEELELCVNILGDILDVLFSSTIGPTHKDVSLLSKEILRDILNIVYKMTREDPLLCQFVSVLISLLRLMTDKHFVSFLNGFTSLLLLNDFLFELLMVIKNLVTNNVFPADWAEMILLQNSVIVKVLRQCARIISEKMRDPFDEVVWNSFFHCAIAFITQPSLQLENFSPSKKMKILSRYRDMRRETANEIKSLWFSLVGQHKIRFVPSMVGPFLKMTMLPEVELRRATIPIFFDMMQCEFYSPKCRGQSQLSEAARKDRKEQKIKGRFDEFENEILEKLDHLIEGGQGDEHFRDIFQNIMSSLCEDHKTMREPGMKLVRTVSRLMERLFQYRTILNTPDNSAESRMSCTVNLLDFYSEINRKELYLRYVYKLAELHLMCDNFTEAAYTLKLHAELLKWSQDPIYHAITSPRHPSLGRHEDLKEALYHDIISYFDQGKMWEAALNLCKELVVHYEEKTLDYIKLAELLNQMASFYNKIMNPQNLRQNIRPEPEYFRVAYYGRGFPGFLQNKVFVYRGHGYERLSDFTTRIMDQFPNAEMMKKLTPPSNEVKDSPQQFIQINKVHCQMMETRFSSPNVAEQIQRYYRANRVKTFTYSRPFHRGQKDPTNEFATLCVEKTVLHTSYELPGILRCYPVVSQESVELSPLENAIETMTGANKDVYDLTRSFINNPSQPLDPLTRKLSGMVDAAVMGGVANYEKAFLCDEYEDNHPEDAPLLHRLKELISEQIPLLEAALHIHANKVVKQSQIQGLHEHLIMSFNRMKTHVQDKYGTAGMPHDLQDHITRISRFQTQVSLNNEHSIRNSHHSTSSHDVSVSSEFEDQQKSKENFGPSSPSSHRSDGFRNSLSRSLHAHSELILGLSGSQLSLPRLSMNPSRSSHSSSPWQSKKSIGGFKSPTPSSGKPVKKESSFSRLLRRESFSNPNKETNTQWFMDNVSRPDSLLLNNPAPIIELSEQVTTPVTPERPLRTEVEREKRASRPTSSNLSTASTPCASTGSRESLSWPSSTMSTTTPTGSLDDVRPPLPAKTRDKDTDSLISNLTLNTCMPLGGVLSDYPAEPPEKPPLPDRNHNHKEA
ncbi:dedicator of cytokinesis protein 1-like isoform X4 [Oratosquilla oratoria]|uniref:dedicator of cytokinesis protein 1-like isoform X4 n=2 Tax=Oratosquilla oratoria TaxID=337810 RepID=UPI003F75C55B